MSIETALLSQQRRTGALIAVGLLSLVIFFSLLLFYGTDNNNLINPVWFIGMLVIFGAALAFIAVTFSWLGLEARGEAFALPSGSVRTLLAVGVMVLFVVFGLASISENGAQKRPSDQLFDSVNFKGTGTLLEEEIKRYESKGLIVLPELSGDGAKLKLYRIENVKTQATIDIEKQILTALITLVTAVVSFYFGSRSVEAAKDAKGKNEGGGSAIPESLASEISTLDANLSEASKRLERLLTEKAATESQASFAAKLAQGKEYLQSAQQIRTQLEAFIKDMVAGRGTSEAVASSVAGLKSKLDSLALLLSETEALVAKG